MRSRTSTRCGEVYRPTEWPAARSAANEEPYSTTRRSCRFHQTSEGMRCTPGPAPVAIRDDILPTGKIFTAGEAAFGREERVQGVLVFSA